MGFDEVEKELMCIIEMHFKEKGSPIFEEMPEYVKEAVKSLFAIYRAKEYA